MADVKWVKLTTDMFDNRKVKHLRRLPEGNNIVLIWVMLLTMAGRCNSGGMIFLTENIPYTPKMLADELDFEENTVVFALQALEQLDMIVTDNGFFTIAGWEEYQNIEGMDKIREQNRLRQKKYYDRKKALSEPNAKPNVSITQPNGAEEEEEGDEEKEIHSFTHSADGEEDLSSLEFRRLPAAGSLPPAVSAASVSHVSSRLPAGSASCSNTCIRLRRTSASCRPTGRTR